MSLPEASAFPAVLVITLLFSEHTEIISDIPPAMMLLDAYVILIAYLEDSLITKLLLFAGTYLFIIVCECPNPPTQIKKLRTEVRSFWREIRTLSAYVRTALRRLMPSKLALNLGHGRSSFSTQSARLCVEPDHNYCEGSNPPTEKQKSSVKRQSFFFGSG